MPGMLVNHSVDQPELLMPPGSGSGHIMALSMERNDDDQIDEIVERLVRRYPSDQISTADLTSRVRGFYGGFATAKVRNFISIFVERLVRRSIETAPPGT